MLAAEIDQFLLREVTAHFAAIPTLDPPPDRVLRAKTVGEFSWGTFMRALVNGGKTVACNICHGEGMKGLANVPRIAGLHPIYIARQLHLFKEGDRTGPDSALMKKPLANLTNDDILNVSAYVASLTP